MYRDARIALIIPALDEEEAIGPVVAAVDRQLIDEVVVVDNGSQDATAEQAAAAGGLVMHEPRRGYGSACLRALRDGPVADIYLFMDGDGSDDPREAAVVLAALFDPEADLVIGSRVLGDAEQGALTPVQRFGNALTCTLVRWLWGVRFTDLGPFRAIRGAALAQLAMDDPDFGWTIEMQVKAAQANLRIKEVPVTRKVRAAGTSKVSGDLRGSYLAGKRILGYVLSAKMREWVQHR